MRGGFGITYDRINNTLSAIYPSLGLGFAQTINVGGPLCSTGPGCDTSGSRALSGFRAGVDGSLPLPVIPAAGIPIIPQGVFADLITYQQTPDFRDGRSNNFNLSVQRELPGSMVLETSYVARLGRNLQQNTSFNSAPYFFVDAASKQSFAQAFDAVAGALRSQQPVATQPWFENQLPGLGTAYLVKNSASDFVNGFVNSIFRTMDVARLRMGLQPYDNTQVRSIRVRVENGTSNYNGLLVSLRKRTSHGLSFDANYTFAKSLDEAGLVQDFSNGYSSSFFPGIDYGNSFFDRTHVFNANFLYELPFGSSVGRTSGWTAKAIQGWYVSGIYVQASGLPLSVNISGAEAFGGDIATSSGAIPTVSPGQFGNSVHSASGSAGIGTNGNPGTGGSGLNLFGNPETVFRSFRPFALSRDTRTGWSNPLRGLPFWNLDLSIGKATRITERTSVRLSADFFNFFNHVNFSDPSLDLQNPGTFGVITDQAAPTNRTSGSRWIQLGLRIEF
ncbi:MAG: hypothetical protein ACR2NN_07810 [Bryobacteraceae bacterium]